MTLFATRSNFKQLLGNPQRKSAPVVRAPALIWHQALWNPVVLAAGRELEKARIERRTAIDRYLHALHEKLDATLRPDKTPLAPGVTNFDTPNREVNSIVLFANTIEPDRKLKPLSRIDGDAKSDLNDAVNEDAQISDLVTYKFKWWELDITIRFELHTEYLAVTIYLDLSWEKTPEQYKRFVGAPVEISGLEATLRKLDELIKQDAAAGDHTASNYVASHEAIFESFWRTFMRDILEVGGDQKTMLLGETFVDFRALVLGSCDPNCPENFAHFQKPFWRKEGKVEPTRPSESYEFWESARKNFWPLMTVEIGGVNFRKQEFTVTKLLGGRAFYMTAFGAQPIDAPSEPRFPLRYLLYSASLNGWELGRLTERLHHLGTMRLAALIDFDKLRAAVYPLREIEREIRSAMTAYHDPILAGVDLQRETQIHRDKERALSSSLSFIARKLADLNAKFDGDIGYRIARSQYYLRLFRENLPALRASILRGYQPYPMFVQRRLGEAFDFVNLLAEQYSRANADEAALFQYYLAQQARCVEVRSRNESIKVARLQETAEYALVGALLPYYCSMIAVHALALPEDSVAARSIWVLAFVVGATAAVRRHLANESISLARRLGGLIRTHKYMALTMALIAVLLALADSNGWRLWGMTVQQWWDAAFRH